MLELPKEMIDSLANLMAISAETAPKAGGQSFLSYKIIKGDEVKELAKSMIDLTESFSDRFFIRDGKNVENSLGVLVVGMKDASTVGVNCGACGYETCKKLQDAAPYEGKSFKGPICAIRFIDFGVALGSAVKTASILNLDNRIMYRIGAAAIKNGMIDADIAMGIPFTITGKSPYFDR